MKVLSDFIEALCLLSRKAGKPILYISYDGYDYNTVEKHIGTELSFLEDLDEKQAWAIRVALMDEYAIVLCDSLKEANRYFDKISPQVKGALVYATVISSKGQQLRTNT